MPHQINWPDWALCFQGQTIGPAGSVPISQGPTAAPTWALLGSQQAPTAGTVVANGSVSVVPAGSLILGILLQETNGVAVQIALGTTPGGSDVLNLGTVLASNVLGIGPDALAQNAFVAQTTIYASSTAWAGAGIKGKVIFG